MKQTNKKSNMLSPSIMEKKEPLQSFILEQYWSMVNNRLEEPLCDMSSISFSYLPSNHYTRGKSLQFTWCLQESCAHSNNKPTHKLPISASNQACPSFSTCKKPQLPQNTWTKFLLLKGASVFPPEVLFQCYQYEMCSHADRQSIIRYHCDIITRRRQHGETCSSCTPEVTDIKGKWITVKTKKRLKIIKIRSNVF